MIRVLEVNVDDLNLGGVFTLIKNVVMNNHTSVQIDIAAIENFENNENIQLFNKYKSNVYYIGSTSNKVKKQINIYKNLKQLLKREKYEYVHIHADTANKLLVSGLAAKSTGATQIILHSHSSGVDGNFRTIKKIIHKCCRRFLKYIGTKFVSCSDIAAKWMFPNLSQEIVIIKNGIDLEKFKFNPVTRKIAREQLHLTCEILVGHVGRFAYQKNHQYLLNILSKLKNKGINSKLLLIGEGVLEGEIKERIHQFSLEDYVIFYGVSDKVNELMQAMDLFVLPSYFEGLPIVGVEAQAAGLPVIFSDQITQEARLIDSVQYLPIQNNSIELWVDSIEEMSHENHSREKAYIELKKRGFDIQDTVYSFLKLYTKEYQK